MKRAAWSVGGVILGLLACGGTTNTMNDASTSDATMSDAGPTCTAGQTPCSGVCTDTAFDPSNCGSCGKTCSSGATCSSGTCSAVQTLCPNDAGAPYYADLQTDNANCGACGDACPGTQTCSSGHCCGAGLTYCGTACTSTRNDAKNCGMCGNACASGSSCLASTCTPIPTSCRDLLVSEGVLLDGGTFVDGGTGKLPDGNYVIDPDGTGPIKPFVVYCFGMDTQTPREYLDLAHTSATSEPGSNFTMVASGGNCSSACGNYYRQFVRVRIQPATLQVDSADLTFALPRDSSLDACWGGLGGACGNTWKNLPWGNGWDCVGPSSATGMANINLRDTGFSIDPSVTFTPNGYLPSGSSTFDTARDTVAVTGGGDCGGNGPPALVQLKQN